MSGNKFHVKSRNLSVVCKYRENDYLTQLLANIILASNNDLII